MEVGGVPPWKVHDQEVGEPVLASEKLMQLPSQTEVEDELITGIGAAQLFTVTVTDELAGQPLASVTKTVYVVVAVGVAVTAEPEVVLKPVAGVQE